jgi:hypothetical protein
MNKCIETIAGRITVCLYYQESGNVGGYISECEFQDVDSIACNTLESIILAHACAGVDIESEQYVAGINTTLEALSNNDLV